MKKIEIFLAVSLLMSNGVSASDAEKNETKQSSLVGVTILNGFSDARLLRGATVIRESDFQNKDILVVTTKLSELQPDDWVHLTEYNSKTKSYDTKLSFYYKNIDKYEGRFF